MRLAWYAGASTALAVSVVLSAFHQRANFYSAMVYLSESNFCLLALVNFIYILYGAFMYGLQRLCFGQLRAIEVDQLSDRAWVAITETCLAMTIFREEIGAWFLVMFTLLVTGKVWGWIGDGRLEVLEQQPPANPRLFHGRLVVSLMMNTLYGIWLLRYSISTVVQQARPNMMVMFLFEFAVLTASSLRTNARYLLTLIDAQIVAAQTSTRLAERRAEVRRQRTEMLRQREEDVAAGREPSVAERDVPNPDDIDELDIEVPGWEAKGQWILVLELVIDFIKLSIYMAFFTVLLMFYGLPVHIIRDVYLTASAFFKRLSSLLKYRRAMHSMSRLPDASADDLGREDTCIICREDMRPWDPVANPGAIERTRPKKLSCGHILHLGCLKSWLERQQVCPTCRTPVLTEGNPPAQNNQNNQNQNIQNRPAQQPAQGPQPRQPGQAPRPQAAQGQAPAQPNDGPGGDGGARPPAPRQRTFNLGPFRVEFTRHDLRDPQALNALLNRGVGAAARGPAEGAAPAAPARAAATQPAAPSTSQILSPEFDHLVNREVTSYQSLQIMQQELQTAQLLLAELARLRQLHQQMENPAPTRSQSTTPTPQVPNPHQMPLPQHFPPAGHARTPPPHSQSFPPFSYPYRGNNLTRFAAPPSTTAIPSGSAELPDGVVLPPGWSMLPLNRMEGQASGTPTAQTAEAGGASGAGGSGGTSTTSATGGTGAPEGQRIPVLAPNPVLPTWGGTSQFFPQSRGATPEVPSAQRQGQGDEARGESGASGGSQKSGGEEGKSEEGKSEEGKSGEKTEEGKSGEKTEEPQDNKSEAQGGEKTEESQTQSEEKTAEPQNVEAAVGGGEEGGEKEDKGKGRAVSLEDADE